MTTPDAMPAEARETLEKVRVLLKEIEFYSDDAFARDRVRQALAIIATPPSPASGSYIGEKGDDRG